MQDVYWRLMPLKGNRREEARLGKSDADLSKSWPTKLGVSIKEIHAHQEIFNIERKIQDALSHCVTRLGIAPETYGP